MLNTLMHPNRDRPQINETLFWRRPMVEMLSHKLRKLPAPTKKIKGTKLDQFTPLVDHIAVSYLKRYLYYSQPNCSVSVCRTTIQRNVCVSGLHVKIYVGPSPFHNYYGNVIFIISSAKVMDSC